MYKELTSVQEFLIEKYNIYFPVEKDIRVLIYAQFGCYILLQQFNTYHLFRLSNFGVHSLLHYKVGFTEHANYLKEHLISDEGEFYYKTVTKETLQKWIEMNS